jgi:hypothetical protein
MRRWAPVLIQNEFVPSGVQPSRQVPIGSVFIDNPEPIPSSYWISCPALLANLPPGVVFLGPSLKMTSTASTSTEKCMISLSDGSHVVNVLDFIPGVATAAYYLSFNVGTDRESNSV